MDVECSHSRMNINVHNVPIEMYVHMQTKKYFYFILKNCYRLLFKYGELSCPMTYNSESINVNTSLYIKSCRYLTADLLLNFQKLICMFLLL